MGQRGTNPWWCVVLLGAAVWCGAGRAHALEDYADEIKLQLDLPEKPACTFCHTRNDRGLAGDTPFSDSLKDRGFARRIGLPSLRIALTALETMNIDSDGDGVTDIDELTAGANPNDPSDRGLPPAEGCSIVSGQRNGFAGLWFVLAVWALLPVLVRRAGVGRWRRAGLRPPSCRR